MLPGNDHHSTHKGNCGPPSLRPTGPLTTLICCSGGGARGDSRSKIRFSGGGCPRALIFYTTACNMERNKRDIFVVFFRTTFLKFSTDGSLGDPNGTRGSRYCIDHLMITNIRVKSACSQ